MGLKIYDIIIIGGGQAGLSVAYFLNRKKCDFLILDKHKKPGGSWQNTWDSLRLFSPTNYNSLSGWQMPGPQKDYPDKNDFIDYLTAYEKRYDFPIQRPVQVKRVRRKDQLFEISTNENKRFYSHVVISATGKAGNPYIPFYPNQRDFQGKQFHSKNYKNANDLKDEKVLIIGGGNSGAQLIAEISKVASTTWVTLEPPNFLPEYMDGHYLFNQATQRYLKKDTSVSNPTLSDIIQIPSVIEANKRGVYTAVRPFSSFYEQGVIWKDGTKEPFDTVIWCTGFRPDLKHLRGLVKIEHNQMKTHGTQSVDCPGLWLVGYGHWTGYASDTIYGVGKTAKETGKAVISYLQQVKNKKEKR